MTTHHLWGAPGRLISCNVASHIGFLCSDWGLTARRRQINHLGLHTGNMRSLSLLPPPCPLSPRPKLLFSVLLIIVSGAGARAH